MPAIRSSQKKSGVTVRTLKGTNVFPETSAQNSQGFGGDNIAAGTGGTLLSAPGAGFAWVITSLFVSASCAVAGGVRVSLTGNLAVVFSAPAGGSTSLSQQLISQPLAIAANTSFGYSSTSTGAAGSVFSISGTAYKATVATVFNPQAAQVIGVPIDSDPAGDIG